jgi:NAD(P)-dependent dehydrogenase (short-subunit alcohol dehydrogenase family)
MGRSTSVNLQGRVAIITGVASGIGRATASRMAMEGARLVLSDVDGETLDEIEAEIGQQSSTPLVIKADATRENEVQEVMNRAEEFHKQIDILVNCIGVEDSPSREEASSNEWGRHVIGNLTGVYLSCCAVAPHMRQRHYGKIINIASSTGRYRSSYFHYRSALQSGVPYASSNGGILALTRELAFELAPDGIYVNAVVPGLILSERKQNEWSRLEEWVRKNILAEMSLGRPGRPDEVAAVVCFLASDKSSYITGTAIDVNGGWWVS